MIFVLGIDAATWSVVTPHLDDLPSFAQLCREGKGKELVIRENLLSASIWCSMFSGKTPEEHGHASYVVNGNIVKRENIRVDFIWDILHRQGKRACALNVPFIVPPYSFNVSYKPVAFGLPTTEKEWHEELEGITRKTRELMDMKPDLLVSVYTLLDRVQHFHWGEQCVLEWYRRLDEKVGQLVFGTGFLDSPDNRLIIISDHGFCSFGEAKIQTLPAETEYGHLKGDHHENALLITANLDGDITRPQDVFHVIKREILNQKN